MLGWTWNDVEAQLDLHRLRYLNREWNLRPPVNELVASYLGYKPPAPKLEQGNDLAGAALGSSLPVAQHALRIDESAWSNRNG